MIFLLVGTIFVVASIQMLPARQDLLEEVLPQDPDFLIKNKYQSYIFWDTGNHLKVLARAKRINHENTNV